MWSLTSSSSTIFRLILLRRSSKARYHLQFRKCLSDLSTRCSQVPQHPSVSSISHGSICINCHDLNKQLQQLLSAQILKGLETWTDRRYLVRQQNLKGYIYTHRFQGSRSQRGRCLLVSEVRSSLNGTIIPRGYCCHHNFIHKLHVCRVCGPNNA